MRQVFPSFALAVGLAGASVLGLIPGSAQGADKDSKAPLFPLICDTKLLAGAYGFNAEGDVAVNGGEFTVFAAVGVIVLKADGSAFITVREVLAGQPEELFETFEGSYTVNEDCTGTAEFENPEPQGTTTWDFVAVDNASELYLITTVEGAVIHADAKRLFLR